MNIDLIRTACQLRLFPRLVKPFQRNCLDKMVAINEIVSEAAATFVEDCKKANLKLRKAEPTEKVEKEYAQAFLAYHLHLHQEKNLVKALP